MKTRNFSPSRRTVMHLATAALCLLGTAGVAHAQAQPWPSKPIKIIVGFAPGGTTDVMARVMAQSLGEALGQSVVVENKPGASGNVAAAEVIRATADGHTFMLAPTSVETANPSLFKQTILPSRDLTPVAGVGRSQMYLVVKPQIVAKDAKELVSMIKADPGKLSYASAGAGTPPHLAGELFNKVLGVQVAHIPYKGAAPALQDVMAGHRTMCLIRVSRSRMCVLARCACWQWLVPSGLRFSLKYLRSRNSVSKAQNSTFGLVCGLPTARQPISMLVWDKK